jgi:hypothetical protein
MDATRLINLGSHRRTLEANNRIGLTVAVPIADRFSLKLVGTTGVTATVGNDYRTIAVAWQVVF